MNTIPGGRYRGSDGTWHDCNGNPLAPADAETERTAERAEAAEVEIPEPQTPAPPEPKARKGK